MTPSRRARPAPRALLAAALLAGCAMPQFDAPSAAGTGTYPELVAIEALLADAAARDRDAEAEAAAAFEARLATRRAPAATPGDDATAEAALRARLIALRARAEALRARDPAAE